LRLRCGCGPTVLKNCKAAGIEGFEARTGHKHGIEPSLSPQRRQEVKQQFADSGITLWGLGTTCEFHSADPAVVQKNIDECKAFIQLGQDLGAHGVKVRPNGLRKDVPVDQTLTQIATALRTCGQFGADHGVEIWLEVHGPETQKPAHIRRIMDLKCPSSGEVDRNRWQNIDHLKATDEIKFVIGTVEDYEWDGLRISGRVVDLTKAQASEEPMRNLYRRWAQFMEAESWDELMTWRRDASREAQAAQ